MEAPMDVNVLVVYWKMLPLADLCSEDSIVVVKWDRIGNTWKLDATLDNVGLRV